MEDPKDYRFCGYAEAVAGHVASRRGLGAVWADYAAKAGGRGDAGEDSYAEALRQHRELDLGRVLRMRARRGRQRSGRLRL